MVSRVFGLLMAAALASCAAWQGSSKPQLQDLANGAPPAPLIAQRAAILAGELAAQRGMADEAAAQYAIAARHSNDPLVAARATQLALNAEDEALATRATERWIELDPGNAGAQEIAARLALRSGRFDAAQAHLIAMVQAAPQGAARGMIEVADVLAAEPAVAASAMGILNAVAEQVGQEAAAEYARAVLAYRLDDPAGAQRAVEQALLLQPDWQEAQLLALRLMLGAKDIGGAERLIRDLHVAAPKDLELRLALGRLLLEHDQLDLARREFENALKISAGNTAAIYALALIGVDAGDYAVASRHFKSLLDRGVRSDDAAFYLGRIAEQQNRLDEALNWYRQVGDGARVLDAAIRQAVVIARQGELASARAVLNNLRGQFTQHELRLYEVEAEILYQAGEMQAARDTYDAALKAYPDDLDLYYGRALANEQLGQIVAAEADLRSVLQQDADNARALNALGYILSNHSQRFLEALGYVQRALAQTPDDPAVIDSMGWLHYRLGDLAQAREYLERAYGKLADPEIAAHLGEVLWHQGEQLRAREIWRKALQENPKHPALLETTQRLDGAI